MKDKLGSRKLWLALASIAYTVVQVFLGGISPIEGVQTVAAVAVAYLAAEAATDVAH